MAPISQSHPEQTYRYTYNSMNQLTVQKVNLICFVPLPTDHLLHVWLHQKYVAQSEKITCRNNFLFVVASSIKFDDVIMLAQYLHTLRYRYNRFIICFNIACFADLLSCFAKRSSEFVYMSRPSVDILKTSRPAFCISGQTAVNYMNKHKQFHFILNIKMSQNMTRKFTRELYIIIVARYEDS